jgi:hypothetical protein
VLVGAQVARAAGVDDQPPFELAEGVLGSKALAWMPHTSGLCHAYNDQVERDRVRELFDAVKKLTWGTCLLSAAGV